MEKKNNVIIVGVITSFITTFMGSALNLSIPLMEEEFGVSTKSIGWVATIYMITCAVLAIPFGRLADNFQRRKILLAGIFVFALASGLGVFSREMWMLLIFRFVQATGASMIFSTNVAMMAAATDENHRGRVMGCAAAANYAGLAAGPILGGMLSHNFGWRAVFLVTACVSSVSFAMGLKNIPKDVDMMNTSCRTSSVKELLQNKVFLFANAAAMINYGANYTLSYIMSVYLQSVRGMSSQNAGFVLITSTAVMTVMAPVFGRLSDKIAPQFLSAAGMAICGSSLVMMAFLQSGASLHIIVTILAIAGLGFAMFSSPNTNAVMSGVKKEDYGISSSVLSTMRSLGNTLSMGVITTVTGIYLGNGNLKTAEPQVIMASLHTVFSVFAILCIFGIFMAVRRKV